ncbi:MAG: hypothetical protein ABR905_23255, partial [Terracidiphilus sp.]
IHTQLLRFITWSNTWLTPWSEFEISQSMQVMWPSTHAPALWRGVFVNHDNITDIATYLRLD